MKFLYWTKFVRYFVNFLNFIQAIAIESPKASCAVVDEVGTIFSGPASLIFGIKKAVSEFLYSIESFFDVIPINFIFLFTKRFI